MFPTDNKYKFFRVIERISKKKGTRFLVQIRMKVEDSITKSQTFDTKTDAEKWAIYKVSELKKKLQSPGWNRVDKFFDEISELHDYSLLSELIDFYLDEVSEHGLKLPKSYRSSLNVIKQHQVSQLPVIELNYKQFEEFCRERLNDVKPSTLSIDFCALNYMFNYILSRFGSNLALPILPEIKSHLTRDGYLTNSECRTNRPELCDKNNLRSWLGNYSAKNNQDYDLQMDFLNYSLLRLSVPFTIKWGDIDWDKNTIRVLNDKSTDDSPKQRLMPMPKLVRHTLTQLLERRVSKHFAALNNTDLTDNKASICELALQNEYLFHTKPRTLSSVIRKGCSELNICNFRDHDLKRDGISMYLENGVSVEQVAEMSGNKDLSVIHRVYKNMNAGEVAKSINKCFD